MAKLKTASEMFGLYDKVDFLINEAERWKTIVKKDLADRGKIVLRNVTTGEDEILSFNCNLCGKVGNCSIHKGTYIIGDCPYMEFREGWEEVG